MDRMAKLVPIDDMPAGAAALKSVLIGLALLPVIMALATWDHAQTNMITAQFAFFHYPVLVAEIVTILIALRSGVGLLHSLGEWPRWALGALVILTAIAFGTAALVATVPMTAMIHSLAMMIHLLFAGALYAMLSRHAPAVDDARFFWAWTIAGSTGYALILAIFVMTVPDPARFDWVRLGLGLVNVRQLGFYCIVGAGAALGFAATTRDAVSYWLSVGAASIMVGVIVWSGSRGPLIALAVAFAAGWAIQPGFRSWRTIRAVVVSVPAGILLSLVHRPPSELYGLVRIFGKASSATVDELSSSRMTIWLGTMRAIVERPLFGHGAAQFRIVVPEGLGSMNSPHNVLLQIALQWGLVGAACFFLLFGFAWARFIRLARFRPEASTPSFFVVNALLVFSLFDVVAFYAYPMVMIAVGMVLVLAAGDD